MATEIQKRLFTVDDYYRMVEAGILSPTDRVELIRGEVVAMSPIGVPHSGAVLRATNMLHSFIGDRAILGIQGPVRLDMYSEPQPDIVLLLPRPDFYTTRHPGPADVLLIVEVSDSTLRYDRETKAGLYAETGIVEYWVTDIPNDCVWAYSEIRDKSYSVVREFHRGEAVVPQLLPDCRIPIEILLP